MSAPHDASRQSQAERLCAEALTLPAEQRVAFVEREAAGNAALVEEVTRRLDEATKAAAGEPTPAAGEDMSGWEEGEKADAWIGMQLGDCRLTRRIAGGGMGVVYEAVQDPPGRKVAVKILRTSVATDEGRLRFEHETRTLAGLRHPGIAQIYEAGTQVTPDGERLPYFVMEHVPGARTLTAYAQAKDLDLRGRLALFVKVCEAVHFGHTRGVIHRDLKPGNILVDADGVPKVIDFGIARTTAADAETPSPRTETGQLVGTLPYMSPEQIMGASAAIDTRSDVYALGVILYELLTGRLPYDLEDLNLIEVAAVIMQRPPLPPARFAPETAGDVSVILQKALAKEPERRYASAVSFQHDLERFLAYQPIQARPPSAGYQLRLLARRNRAAFLAAVAALLALVAATVLSIRSAAEEVRAREAAEAQKARAENLLAQTRQLVPWLLKDFDHEVASLPGSLVARSQLADRVKAYLATLQVTERDHPDVLRSAALAHVALGELLGGPGSGNLGRQREALQEYEKAAALWSQLLAANPEDDVSKHDLAVVWLGAAYVHNQQGASAVARGLIERALRVALELTERSPEDEAARRLRLRVWEDRAHQAWADERWEEGLADYRRVLAEHEAISMPGETAKKRMRRVTEARLNLGTALLERSARDEAAPLLAQVETEIATFEDDDADLEDLQLARYVHWSVGQVRLQAGQYDAAERDAQAALRIARRWAARDVNNVAAQVQVQNALGLLGRIAEKQARWSDADRWLREALDSAQRLSAREVPESNLRSDLRMLLMRHGTVLGFLGRFVEADRQLLAALALAKDRRRALPEERYALQAEFEVLRKRSALGMQKLLVVEAVDPIRRHLGIDLSTKAQGWLRQAKIGAITEARLWTARAADTLTTLRNVGPLEPSEEVLLARIRADVEAWDAQIEELRR